ncbi:MAG: 50S ribosomal protein L2 [Bacteroides sp.]|nr:MAG: 50S ribosomal protein L2 [Bacteroides sp.]
MLKKINPTTPGQRFKVDVCHKNIVTTNIPKNLFKNKKSSGGRNNKGKMTVKCIGGGHKQKYRIIDFKRDKTNIVSFVKSIEYDPNRNCNIALLNYSDGEKRYIIAPYGLKIDQKIQSGDKSSIDIGNALKISAIPLGTIIHNIELIPGNGGVLARSAGSFAQLTSKKDKYATLKLPSGEIRLILINCMATIGIVSNIDHSNIKLGKAGSARWLGRRPRTRGVAMNPVDHPMGGGEGRASGGHPRSKTGLLSKGLKTRKKNKNSSKYIVKKRK